MDGVLLYYNQVRLQKYDKWQTLIISFLIEKYKRKVSFVRSFVRSFFVNGFDIYIRGI